MDSLHKLQLRSRQLIATVIILENLVLLGACWLAGFGPHSSPAVLLLGVLAAVALSFASMLVASYYILQPFDAIWRLVLHLSPTGQGVVPPKIEALQFGKEVVGSLSTQLYQIADIAEKAAAESKAKNSDVSQNFVAQNLPLPLLILDATETIVFANPAAEQYVGIPATELIGKNVYMVFDMSFPNTDTFDVWLKEVKSRSATATASWERVRLNVHDSHPARLFDLAAFYNRDNPNHTETIMALFDHTKQYSQDDQAVSFIALSVHELRTPLTLLRGYIEVFEEELASSNDPELRDFMEKMRSQAEQLMAFVNNILNVARVDDDQLELHLQEQNWTEVLKKAVQNISLRAKVRGITLQCRLATDLPPVGADRLSIQEVINNLIDNAIKYSGQSTVINIETKLNSEGQIETTVQDFGLGISTSIMPNLFTKFYRDHRNRAQIGGTGLGLYLSKAIVEAHGGTMWVRSTEGKGSVFGFTLMPYAQVAEELKKTGEQEITRGAHGWIKNHSLYRR